MEDAMEALMGATSVMMMAHIIDAIDLSASLALCEHLGLTRDAHVEWWLWLWIQWSPAIQKLASKWAFHI